MKKIPCVFKRDFTDRKNPILLNEVNPGCEWVLAGEGKATRKWDGTACAIIKGELHARYDAKNGKTPPPGAIPCGDPDPVTGHWPHWVKADRPEDRWLRQAKDATTGLVDGTYEAVGPKINGNHDAHDIHVLHRHGDMELYGLLRTFDGLKAFLEADFEGEKIEGIVFHHPDGRMAKLRRDDYGLPWPP